MALIRSSFSCQSDQATCGVGLCCASDQTCVYEGQCAAKTDHYTGKTPPGGSGIMTSKHCGCKDSTTLTTSSGNDAGAASTTPWPSEASSTTFPSSTSTYLNTKTSSLLVTTTSSSILPSSSLVNATQATAANNTSPEPSGLSGGAIAGIAIGAAAGLVILVILVASCFPGLLSLLLRAVGIYKRPRSTPSEGRGTSTETYTESASTYLDSESGRREARHRSAYRDTIFPSLGSVLIALGLASRRTKSSDKGTYYSRHSKNKDDKGRSQGKPQSSISLGNIGLLSSFLVVAGLPRRPKPTQKPNAHSPKEIIQRNRLSKSVANRDRRQDNGKETARRVRGDNCQTQNHHQELPTSENATNYGLIELSPSDETSGSSVDIVFIHGLTGNSHNTWYHRRSRVHWPTTILYDSLWEEGLDARIFAFGYDANIVNIMGPASRNRIGNHAVNLLGAIARRRERSSSDHRSLIFVAHSLGGLVVQDALCQSRNSAEVHIRRIESCTMGLLFMGTPHHGANLAAWASLGLKVARLVRQPNIDLVNVLRPGSEVLSRIQREFTNLLRIRQESRDPIFVTCFYEELPVTTCGEIVPQASSIIHGYESYGIRANHMNMTKFPNAEDHGFDSVFGELLRWIRTIDRG